MKSNLKVKEFPMELGQKAEKTEEEEKRFFPFQMTAVVQQQNGVLCWTIEEISEFSEWALLFLLAWDELKVKKTC